MWKLVLAAAVSLVLLFSPARGAESPRAFAKSIFELMDQEKYDEVYKHFDSSMRQQVSKEQWARMAAQVRQQVGKNQSRAFKSEQKSVGIVQVRFDSRYDVGGQAIDEVYVVEQDDTLKVSGLWVRPAFQ